jgi:hypothetical protein
MTTVKQDRDFADLVLDDMLENSIDWIAKNLAPEEVFSDDKLANWAESHGFILKNSNE